MQVVPQKRRRKSQSNGGNIVSLGQVWEYEEDVPPFEEDGQCLPAKKRKQAAPKKSQSTTTQPRCEQRQYDEPDDTINTPAKVHGFGSQLTTPPDSSKKASRRHKSKVISKRGASNAFPNATITKSTLSRDKGRLQEPAIAQPNSIYSGWKTTEDQVKSTPVGLTKTTVQKLAGFRYKPKPIEDVDLSSATIEQEDDLHQHCGNGNQSDHASPPFFDEAMWNEGVGNARDTAEVMIEDRPNLNVAASPTQDRSDAFIGQQTHQDPIKEYQGETEAHRSQYIQAHTNDRLGYSDDNAVAQQSSSDSNPVMLDMTQELSHMIGSVDDIVDDDGGHNAQSKEASLAGEFDEGLDNGDLMMLVPRPSSPSISARQEHDENYRPVARLHCEPANDRTLAQLSPLAGRTSNVDPAEEQFAVDEELEAQMYELAQLAVGTQEKHAPPSTLQFAFDDESVNREVYDSTLQFSSPRSGVSMQGNAAEANPTNSSSPSSIRLIGGQVVVPNHAEEDWVFIHNEADTGNEQLGTEILVGATDPASTTQLVQGTATEKHHSLRAFERTSISDARDELDDRHEYEPLKPFARPDYPALIRDRSPVHGLSTQMFLRTCFRIGEMIKEGARCNALRQDAIIELFARVTFSSREPNSSKQHIQFADLFHDRPPFPNGVLANFKSSGLAESESKVFIEKEGEVMARCLGRLKRDVRGECWGLNVLQIRPTDWEEVRWTKRVVSGDRVKAEKMVGKL